MRGKIIFPFLLWICSIGIYKQVNATGKYSFDRISVKDGLSHGIVHCILNDSKGYMWFGTDDGLNKFDGYRFTIYKPIVGDTTSISSNIIKSLYEDKTGNIWIGTAGGGLNKYNRSSDTFQRYVSDKKDSLSISDNNVYSIFEDSRQNLWVGTFGGGLNLFNRITETFTHYRHSSYRNSISGDAIRAIVEDGNGDIWIGVDEGGLDKLDMKTGQFSNWSYHENVDSSLSNNAVLSITIDHNGFFWVGTWAGGVNIFDPVTGKFSVLQHDPLNGNSISSNETFSIFEDINNRMWITTRNGIDIYDPQTNTFVHNRNDQYDETSMSHNFGTCLYQDKTGVLWIGTGGGGLNKYDQYGKPFGHIKKGLNSTNTLNANDIYSIYEDSDKQLWIGVKGGGVNIFNPNTGNYRYIDESTLTNPTVRAIAEAPDGKIWLGTDGGGINIVDKYTGQLIEVLEHNATQSNSLSNNAVYDIHIDRQGRAWIGMYGGGLDVYSIRKKSFHHYPINYRNQMQNVVLDIEEDSRGRIWIGTLGMGLWEFDKSRNKLISYKTYIKDSSRLSNMVINDIFIDRKEILWIATGGNGFDKFDLKKGEITNYDSHKGLVNDNVCSIQEDLNYNFWISTNNGLCRFDPHSGQFQTYTLSDGLQDVIYNPRASCRTSTNRILFGGINGLNSFDPDSILSNPYTPQVVITDFKIFNKSVHPDEDSPIKKHVGEVDTIVLSYKQNIISFEFAALHYVCPSDNKYRYRLEGLDKDWITTTANRRYASYTNLPGGEYTFRVIAANNDNEWNEQGVSITLIVIPPFWQTAWFYLMLILLISLSIFIIIKQKEKIYKRRQLILEERVKARTQEIKSQKEELQLINLQLNQQQEELRAQSEYLQDINSQLNDQASQLKEKSDMLLETNLELKTKNMLITESIKYAQKIQDSILPDESLFGQIFDDHFILYKPKDIVSGDFYWTAQVDSDEWGKPIEMTYIAAIDCTGHGVPGAFMSMIGHTLLNEIVITKCIRKPSDILKHLNKDITRALAKDGKDSQDDGMDISICAIDHQMEEVHIASAMQSVYRIRDGKLDKIDGDIFSIGEILSIIKKPDFTNHIFEYQDGDLIYMFSDGYQDQFGGEEGHKFMESRFRELIQDIHHLEMEEQKVILERTFNRWKGEQRQIDDIMVIGFRF